MVVRMMGADRECTFTYKVIILDTTIDITITIHPREWIQLGCANTDPDFAFRKKVMQTLQKRVTGLAYLGDAIGGA